MWGIEMTCTCHCHIQTQQVFNTDTQEWETKNYDKCLECVKEHDDETI